MKSNLLKHFTKLLKNTKTRTFVIVLGTVLVVSLLVAIISGGKPDEPLKNQASTTASVPQAVESVPGTATTPRYRQLQEKANLRGAQQAAKEGKTFVPTITGSANAGFGDNGAQEFESAVRGLGLTTTKGCSAGDAKLLADKNYSAAQIAIEMKARGCSANDIANALRALGFSAADIANALKAAGFSDSEINNALQAAGFTQAQAKQAISALDQCSSQAAKRLQDKGLDIYAITKEMKENGCSLDDIVKALKALGYNANQIAAALRAAGFSDNEIANALKAAGFTSKQIKQALSKLKQLCSAKTANSLRKEGYSATDIAKTMHTQGCSEDDIRKALQAIGLSNSAINNALASLEPCSSKNAIYLKQQGKTASEITKIMQQQGCSLDDIIKALKAAGLELPQKPKPPEVTTANKCSAAMASQLKSQGLNVKQIAAKMESQGCSAEDIAKALKAIGYTPTEIASALKAIGTSNDGISKALEQAGVSKAETIAAVSALSIGQKNLDKLLTKQQEIRQRQKTIDQQKKIKAESEKIVAMNQQRLQAIQQVATAMEKQKNDALAAWNNIPAQGYVAGKYAETLTGASLESADAILNAGGSSGSSSSGSTEPFLKAGSILFAVMETSVNSDEPGPVLARIISGPLKGTLLLGTMSTTSSGEAVSISFDTINIPTQAASLSINAVAIDPDTARTALASEVDHHYLLKWGSVFAASFLEGYSKAVSSLGTSTTTTGTTGSTTTTTNPKLSGREQLFAGLGKIGEAWSSAASKYTTISPTVTIDSGEGIGVLLISDLTLGNVAAAKNPSDNFKNTAAATAATAATTAATAATAATTTATTGSNK